MKYQKIRWALEVLHLRLQLISVFFMVSIRSKNLEANQPKENAIPGGGLNIVYFNHYLGKISHLTDIFQMGWNHQPVYLVPWWLLNMLEKNYMWTIRAQI